VKILGIDPGVANTGFGVVASAGMRSSAVTAGVVTTRAGVALESRLATLFSDIDGLLDEHAPVAIALEEIYFGQNASSAMVVGQARGVVLLAAGRRGMPAFSYTPQQIKQAVCGSGRAAKDQVTKMVAGQLGLDATSLPDHAADALAVAICHLNHAPLAHALAGAR
jgi:crossover junction endodeoxyribonuclease RuvC